MPSRSVEAADREARETRARRRRLWVLSGVGAIGVVAVAAAGLLALGHRPAPTLPSPTGRPAPIQPGVARAYYELVAGRGTTLMERSLDGRSLPRVVATQPGAEYARVFTVGPDDTWAVTAVSVDDPVLGEATRIARVRISDGARDDEGTFAGSVDVDDGVWSADGAAWAVRIYDADKDEAGLLLVDLVAGRARVVAQDLGRPYRFEDRGRLLLESEVRRPDGTIGGWRFSRLDASAGDVTPLGPGALATIGDGGAAGSLSLALGVGIDVRWKDEGPQEGAMPARLVLHDLRTEAERDLGRFEELDWASFDPLSRWVATCGAHHVALLSLDGVARDLLVDQGLDCVDRGRFSPGGGLLGLTDWDDRSVLRVLDVATAASVILPLPEAIAEAHLVAIHGESLPPQPLPLRADPGPPPVPTGGDPVPGAPTLIRLWTDRAPDGAVLIRGARVSAGDSGGLTLIAAMAPIPVPEAARAPEGTVWATGVRSPVSDDVLVQVLWEGGGQLWVWHADGERERLRAPAGWPTDAPAYAWSPDGRSLATTRTREDGSAELVTWRVTTDRLRAVPMPPMYDTVGAWPRGNRIVVGHEVCTEGCPGRYAFSLVVDPSDGSVRPVGRDGTSDGIPLHITWVVDGKVMLDAVAEDIGDDRVLDWPEALPRVIDARRQGASDLVVIAGDLVDGLALYRVSGALDAAADADAPDDPVPLGRLPAGAAFGWLSDDGRWALTDELGTPGALVDLATGREFAIEPQESSAFVP